LRKILVANRGEIAVRVIRACRDMGLTSVAVYSECDRAARHVRMADEACAIGPSPPADSYLNIDRLIEAARVTGADAVHPGYGFLAENPAFASACRDANLIFIGPAPETIALMGNKTAARRVAIGAGVPVVPGTDEPFAVGESDATIEAAAVRIGYPLLVKAVAGGGGKGMRRVAGPGELAGAIRAARSEAGTAFGDSAVYLERQLQRARHIEVQLLGDQHGTVIPFVERECSIQRRHQKAIEETPSPAVSSALRARLTSAAAAVARSVGYVGAGTIEFLLDDEGAFWFLEMNARLQVEHPITETVTGVDLVEWQLRIANGERLSIEPAAALMPRGHAIECRVYAEDPDAGFLPSPGLITFLRAPDGPWVRDDRGAETQSEVSIYYDPLISKLTVWGTSRTQTIARLKRALWEYRVLGIRTTVPFFRWMLDQPSFRAGTFHTGSLDELLQSQAGNPFVVAEEAEEDVAAIAAALHAAARIDSSGPSDRTERGSTAFASRQTRTSPGAPVRRPGEGWTREARLEALRS
jgi:acetyl-CoA carboxylase biotin carboxylase subunit